MLEFNIPRKLITFIGMILKYIKRRIKVMISSLEPLYIRSGLRQTHSFSSLLFNLVIEKAIKDSGINTNSIV